MSGWDKYEERIDRGPWSAFLWIFGTIFVMGSIGSCVAFVSNPFTQAARVVNKTIDADNVINNYEWFKQQAADITAIEAKIDQSRSEVSAFESSLGARSDWDREDKIEHARLSSISSGLEMQRADMASKYNARSRMVNRSIFKAGDVELPNSISEVYP